MLLSDIIRLSMKTLSEKRFRAILTIIGISIGPLALVMIYGVTSGYSQYIIEQIKGLGQNLIAVLPEEEYSFSEKDLEILSIIPGVADVSPFYSTQGYMKWGFETKNIYVYAVHYDFLFKTIPSLRIREGSIPSETEIVKCLIGYNIAFDDKGHEIYGVGDVISLTIYRVEEAGRISEHRITLLVSGVLDKYGGAALLNPDDTVFISLEAAEKILGLRRWSGILLYVEDTGLISNITSTIRELYGSTVRITSFYAIAQIAQSITGAVNFMTFSASLAAFAVAIAGVAATMITSVIERTREIGVLKALGFTDKQVLILILSEGILMSLIGAVIGISLGVIGANILASQGLVIRAGETIIHIQAPPNLSPQIILITIFLTILVGILGSLFPAYRAAKIPPAEALRYE